uniref:Glutamine amidotransferase type-2 domain-containing protein n=1 Tax=Kalanchoe fedtschenkoi TaxID=63787 RepID=A0A7N0ZR91_KALFE
MATASYSTLHLLPKTLAKISPFHPKPHSLSHPSFPNPHKNPPILSCKASIFHLDEPAHSDPDDDSNVHAFGGDDDKPREECGVVGIYGDPEASRLCFLALHALQHRGQEGAGIVAVQDSVLKSVTGVGLVSEVFNESKLAKLPGSCAIGHVRYSTAGASMLKNVQPFVAGYRYAIMSLI